MMADTALRFFTPAPHPADEAARQAVVDGIRYADAAGDPRLAAIVARAAELFETPVAVISIVDRDRQNWIVRTGVAEDGTPRAISFCGHVVFRPDEVLAVTDVHGDARFAGNPMVTGANVAFYAGAALLHEGAALGTLCVTDRAPRANISDAARAELTRLAAEASAILAEYR